MKLFNFLFYGLIGSLLLFGVVMEGYGQDVSRECYLCQPNENAAASQFNLGSISFTNSIGEPIDFDNCPDPDDIYITITYQTNRNRNRVVFISNLEITTNSGVNSGQVRSASFDFILGDLPATGAGFQTETIKVDLPLSFDCKNETARLSDIQINWTGPGNANICDGFNYPPGQCANLQNATRVISSDELFYSFRLIENCFEEDNKVLNTYILTNTAGGSGEYDVIWTITVNGITSTVEGSLPDPDLVFVIVEGFPDDEIIVNVEVVSGELEMDDPPPAIERIIPEPFEVTIDVLPNVGDVFPSPNGSIMLNDLDPTKTFTFEWIDDEGNILEGITDPTNLTGLSDGTYFLFMTDETGIVRCFSRTLGFVPTPVVYENLSIYFNTPLRSVDFFWSTTKEWEASHYDVERAVNGTQFEKIGEVKAAGWSDQLSEYLFEDKMLPLSGGNLLYRLKQVDFNGDFEYSKVLSVRVPGVEFTSGVWRAYPNPTDGNALRISLLDASQYNNEPLTFRLIHPMAQSPAMTLPSEMELNEVLTQMTARIPKGVFVVEIQWGQKVEHIKVLKQ